MKKRFRKFTAAITALLLAVSALAPSFAVAAEDVPDTEPETSKTYYIATNGDDANPGTMEAPKKTGASVAGSLKPGDTVIFREGTYNGVMVLQGLGSSEGDPITIKACEGENVTLTSDNNQYVIFLGHAQNVIVEGLTFSGKNGAKRGNGIDMVNFDASLQRTGDIVIRGCTFVDCEPAFIVRDVIENQPVDKKFGNMTFENNIIMPSDPEKKLGKGIALQEMRIADDCLGVIRNNVILNAKWSLHMWGRSENVLVYNNTFLDTYDKNEGGQYDIYPVQGSYNRTLYTLDISHNCVFKNNIFTKPIRTQLEGGSSILDEDKGNIFDYNLYDAGSLADYVTYNYGGEGPKLNFEELQSYQNRGLEANGKYAAVSFTDRLADAHLSGAANPGISGAAASITDSVDAPETDLEGRTRNGEFGAYAYSASLVFVGPNDGEGDGSAEDPYPSLKAALEAGAKEIQVKEGVYDEDGLTIPADVSLKPYRGASVTVSGAVAFSGAALVSGIRFTGDVTAANDAAFTGCFFEAPLAITGENASVSASFAEAGILLKNARGARIVNCLLTGAETALTLTGSKNVSILNNTFYANSKDISADADSTGKILNNIFSAENTLSGGMDADYNCYNAASLSAEYLNSITEENSVKADPQFLNIRNGDFRLYRQSPCAGKGSSAAGVDTDINGLKRSSPCSMGAYELSDIQNIYYVSVNGDDSAAGTENAPFRTIGAAVAVVRPGEEIHVLEGTYTEDVTVSGKAAFAGSGCTITGQNAVLDGSLTVADCENLRISGFTVNNTVTVESSTNLDLASLNLSDTVCLKGSSVAASQLTLSGAGIEANGGSLRLNRVKISGAETALSVSGQCALILTASQIVDCATGVLATEDSPLHVVNNTFYDVSGYSVDVTQQNSRDIDLDLYNNIYARSNRTGAPFIRVNKAYGFNTENNIYDADADQKIGTILTADTDGAPLEDRDLNAMQAGGDDTASVAADPMLRDPANSDFSPKKGSPAARNGRSDAYAPKADFNGTAFAATPDIGSVYSPFTMRTFNVVPYGLGWGNYGDSSNPILPDGSWDHPFTSLKDALKVVGSSDTIVIHKAVYDWGRIDLNDLHGVADAPITIEACTNEGCWYCTSYDNRSFWGCPADAPALDRPVLTGSQKYSFQDPAIKAESDLCMKLTNCSYITIRGLEIAGFSGAGIWVYGGDHIVLEDNHVWNIDSKEDITSGVEGFLLNDISDSEILNNRIWNIGYTRRSHADHGIYVGGVDNCTFSGNVIVNSPGGGMQFYAGDSYKVHGRSCTIENNVFYRARMGLILCGIENFDVVNNTFVDSLGEDLYLDWTVKNNCFANNLFSNSLTGETTGLQKDPSIIARHNGAGDCAVTDNVFANSIYDFHGHTPYAEEGWGTYMTFDRFLELQEGINTFTEFNPGKAGFLKGTADDALSASELAAQVDLELFRTTYQTSGLNKALADKAPALDRDGNARSGEPDIGAYEAQDVRALSLSENQLEENNAPGAEIGTFFILGQDAQEGDSFTLVEGEGDADNDSFIIDGNTLKPLVSFDYETKSAYSIRVKAVSGDYIEEKSFTIQVINVEEPAVADHWINLIHETITPDGKLDEAAWEKGQFAELTVGQDNATEFRASIGLLADETALYVAAKVTDSELSNDLVPGVDFNADMVELYLDGLNLESGAYDASTVQFQFRWGDEKLWIYGNSKKFENVKFTMAATDDGYILEAVIPWADLGVEFDPNNTIGLTADVQDYDSSTGKSMSVAMIEGEGFWNNSSAWESYGFREEQEPDAGDGSIIARRGWSKSRNGKWFFYDQKGRKIKGWHYDADGCWYYLDKTSGEMVTGWLKDNGSTYYLRSWGGMITGWFCADGQWYYADGSGAVLDLANAFGETVSSYASADGSGIWCKDAKGQWAFNENGSYAVGWRLIDNTWYFFGTDHVMKTGWQFVNGIWYYLNANGKMATGWKLVAKKWYYLRSWGGMISNGVTPDGYRVDVSGAWIG